MRRSEMTQALASAGTDLARKALSFYIIPLSMVIGQGFVFWLSTKVSFFPGSDTFLSIVSTCSEIIAGLYGITMAGYTFFPFPHRQSMRVGWNTGLCRSKHQESV